MRLGATEILLILVIALVVFGSDKLSGLGKALGTSIREFKAEIKQEKEDLPETAGTGESAVSQSAAVKNPSDDSSSMKNA